MGGDRGSGSMGGDRGSGSVRGDGSSSITTNILEKILALEVFDVISYITFYTDNREYFQHNPC